MITSFTARPLGVGGTAWRLTWASDLVPPPDPTFYLYRDGVKVAETQLTSLVVSVAAGESPVFEVFDDAAERPTSAYPDHATLAWYDVGGAAAAAAFRVERFVDAAWVAEATIVPAAGQTYFLWRSRPLADSTTHAFRVIPVGDNGNDGTARAFQLLMVRISEPPSVTMTYDAGTGEVTIAAAA